MVAGGNLPLAFIGLGLAALATAAVWLLRQPGLLSLPFMHPQVVAFVHLWLPGVLLSICVGAVYQLMPVVLGAPLKANVSGLWIHFGLHAVGVVCLVRAFTTSQFAWAGLGGTFITIGAVILMVATVRTFRSADRRDASAWCFPLANGWLVATVVFGIALALNRRWPVLPLSAIDLLRAHAHLGLAGFFLTLLQGTTFQLVPMFTMGELRRPRLIWSGLVATQAGLLALAPGLAWGIDWLTRTGAVILVGGLACSAVALVATFRTRRRRKTEPGIKAFFVGAAALAVAALIGAVLAFAPASVSSSHAWITAYGVLLIPGALSLTILGMLCKIVPFLVWMRSYGPKVGKQPVPIATALASRALENGWWIAHVGGLVLLVAGFATSGAVLLAAATALFLANMVRVLAHLRPRAPIPLPA